MANKNKERMGVTNVEVLRRYVEDIPLPDENADVIISASSTCLKINRVLGFMKINRVLGFRGSLPLLP